MKFDQIKVAVLTIAVTLLVVLMIQNTEVVETRIYFWVLPLPRFVLLGLMLLMGGLVGYVLGRKRGRSAAEDRAADAAAGAAPVGEDPASADPPPA